MMEVTKDLLMKIGGKVEMVDIGKQEFSPDITLPLPPVILAEFGSDTSKPTVCFYGHVDVQPAKKEDGWASDPYTLREENGNFYGRGTSDDKGQVLAMINAVEAVQNLSLDVNVKIVIEGMEEVGSQGLEKLVEERKETFFADVDHVVMTDNLWLSKKPSIAYGARGDCYFTLEVEGTNRDLHSGDFGGTVYEAMNDVIFLLGQLADVNGKILIPGIYDAVSPLTDLEKESYKNIEFSLDDMMKDIGVKKLLHDTKEELLMYRWRYPSLSLHGIEGAFCGSGTKTVIPAKVIGKFSMRQAPDMIPSVVEKMVTDYLESKFLERKSPNKMKVSMVIGAKPWLANINDPIFVAAQKAIKRVFNFQPDMIRSGGTIPIAKRFEEIVASSVMLFGIAGADSALHGQNENISNCSLLYLFQNQGILSMNWSYELVPRTGMHILDESAPVPYSITLEELNHMQHFYKNFHQFSFVMSEFIAQVSPEKTFLPESILLFVAITLHSFEPVFIITSFKDELPSWKKDVIVLSNPIIVFKLPVVPGQKIAEPMAVVEDEPV
ncbi:cytosolic non-specific dipeptidase-like [Gastrophryne carolinensis]